MNKTVYAALNILRLKRVQFFIQLLLSACGILFVLLTANAQETIANQQAKTIAIDGIMTVDIPYNLFIALVLYHELSEQEKTLETDSVQPETEQKLNEELIFAIQDIVSELELEKNKFQALANDKKNAEEITLLLTRIDQSLGYFQQELTFRQKVAQYLELKQQQRNYMENR